MVAARVRPDRPGRGPGLEPARPRPFDLDDGKGLVELVARTRGPAAPRLHAARPTIPPSIPAGPPWPWLGTVSRGASASSIPRLIAELELRAERVIVAEVAVAGLSGGQPAVPIGRTPSRHPVVERDLAIVVADVRTAGEVEAAIRRHAGPLLASVDLFDIYRGRPLPDDRRSLAFRLVFAASDRTLTEAEVDRAVADIATGLATDVDGHLRA